MIKECHFAKANFEFAENEHPRTHDHDKKGRPTIGMDIPSKAVIPLSKK